MEVLIDIVFDTLSEVVECKVVLSVWFAEVICDVI
jgi:hypothetical protein